MVDIINLDDHRQLLVDMDIYASMMAEKYEAQYHEPPEDCAECCEEGCAENYTPD